LSIVEHCNVHCSLCKRTLSPRYDDDDDVGKICDNQIINDMALPERDCGAIWWVILFYWVFCEMAAKSHIRMRSTDEVYVSLAYAVRRCSTVAHSPLH